MFSRRTAWDFTPNDLAMARRSPSFSGTWIDLTESNPTVVGLQVPVDEVTAALSRVESAVYEPASTGLASVRRLVAETYASAGVQVEPYDIVLTASSSEAYAFLLKLLCDPGDTILVPQPSYPLFDDLARLEAVRVRGYPLRAQDDWRADTRVLAEAVDETVRAVFVVSPNNPTGSYLVHDELAAIESVASANGLALVCDEVFSDYVWRDDPSRVRCAASSASVLAFSLGGLSKSACLPQMKLGWIVAGGPAEQRQDAIKRLEMIGDTFLSVGTPVQHAARALVDAGCRVREELRERILRNIDVLHTVLGPSTAVSVLPVRAGWYAVLRLPRVMSGERWAAQLAASEGVLTHPGEFFGFEEQACLVVSLIPPTARLSEGIARIAKRVRRVVEQG